MILLFQLLRFHLVDARQQRARLIDLAIGSLDTDYPAVTQLLYHQPGQTRRLLPWQAVTGLNRKAREVQVPDLALGQALTGSERPNVVWLGRDVLDAIMIDLRRRQVPRANDLLLSGGQNNLRLRAVDTGLLGIVRRMSGGLFEGLRRRNLHDWKQVEFLRGDPNLARNGSDYNRRINQLPAGQIAHLAEPLPYLHAAELLELLPGTLAADTLEVMSIERQLQIFEELEPERARILLGLMAPDVAADLLGRLDPELARQLLNQLPKAKAQRLVELLRYPVNTVGGAMTNDVLSVAENLTVGQARQALRQRLKEPDFVHFMYVVDGDQQRRLRGVLSLRSFVAAGDDNLIRDLMNRHLLTLSPLEPSRAAAYTVLESELAALPVVDANDRLLGALTVDVAVSLVAPKSWRSQAPRVYS